MISPKNIAFKGILNVFSESDSRSVNHVLEQERHEDYQLVNIIMKNKFSVFIANFWPNPIISQTNVKINESKLQIEQFLKFLIKRLSHQKMRKKSLKNTEA